MHVGYPTDEALLNTNVMLTHAAQGEHFDPGAGNYVPNQPAAAAMGHYAKSRWF